MRQQQGPKVSNEQFLQIHIYKFIYASWGVISGTPYLYYCYIFSNSYRQRALN